MRCDGLRGAGWLAVLMLESYLRWAVGAFELATSGVADSTQIHTHLCYSEFGEVIRAIADLDADVTSIKAARSRMEVLDDLNAIGFANMWDPACVTSTRRGYRRPQISPNRCAPQ